MFASGALYRYLYRRWLFTLGVMGLSLLLFGASSLNLARIFVAAWEFFSEYGLIAIQEGVLRQFAELLISSYIACAFYVVFKLCGQVLADRLAGKGAAS